MAGLEPQAALPRALQSLQLLWHISAAGVQLTTHQFFRFLYITVCYFRREVDGRNVVSYRTAWLSGDTSDFSSGSDGFRIYVWTPTGLTGSLWAFLSLCCQTPV
jgi:hypothetical protein